MMKVTEVNTMLKTFIQKQDESDKDIKEMKESLKVLPTTIQALLADRTNKKKLLIIVRAHLKVLKMHHGVLSLG